MGGVVTSALSGELELSNDVTNMPALLEIFGLLLLGGAVALHRLATRMRLSRPVTVSVTDRRRPILYLRSFVDDRLTVRIAPFARHSLMERLSSRRKQGFEEIIAEELSRYAPVVAVGEPGRRLAPIGFTREALPNDQWQVAVEQRMWAAAAIVVVLGRSAGLSWELETLIRTGAWRKTVIVFPPVNRAELTSRWSQVDPILRLGDIRGVTLPKPSGSLLTLTFTDNAQCRFYSADDADPWAYKAATLSALKDAGAW